MIGVKVSIDNYLPRLQPRIDQANYRALRKAAGTIRLIARRSIREAPQGQASPPGKPPRTRGRKRLRESVLYAVHPAGDEAVIGPSRSMIGPAGAAHEFGGEFRGDDYPARPYMGPALSKAASGGKLAAHWRNSIKQ